MFGIANVLIERPIRMKNGSSAVQGSFLCPNDQILGRVKTSEGIFTLNVSTKSRQNIINGIVKSFWKKWILHYFPALMVQQKWQCVKRNLRVGNVIVQDQNTIKGTWK